MYKPLLKQKLLFLLFDFTLILFAFAVAFYVRLGGFQRTDFPFIPYLHNAILISPVWLFFLIWGGKYSLQERKWIDMLRIVSLSSIAGALLFVLIFFFKREIFFSRLIVLFIFLFGTLFLMLSHFLEKYDEQLKGKKGLHVLQTLIIGTNRSAQEITSSLVSSCSRYKPVAILAPFGGHRKEIAGVPVKGKLDALEKVVDSEKIDSIIVCDGTEQVINLLSFAEGRFLEFRVSPEILGVFRENIEPDTLSGKTLLSLKATPLFGWGQFWKRLFDVLFSLFGLLFLLPIFFIQKTFRFRKNLFRKEDRIGACGRKFQMYRYANLESIAGDIPNFFNILRGEMSVVGPRPAIDEEWETLPDHYKRRMILRPGMLGLWQIRKLRGEHDDFEKMFQEDMKYIFQWSFWGDVKIILHSFGLFFCRRSKKSQENT